MQPGETLGPYAILEPLGRGGMGEVYLAQDTRLGRKVAIKIVADRLGADEGAKGRLMQEARLASALNHPHICTVYDVGEEEDELYIAIEYVDGSRLSDLIEGGQLQLDHAIHYGGQIADALAHAHAHSVVHRDLKSANVMVTGEGQAKVLDFGIARRLGGDELEEACTSVMTLADAGWMGGTLAYMAPELLRGVEADERSDIWALGVVLHEVASGARPFGGNTPFELSSGILNDDPPALAAAVSGQLGAIIDKCLTKDAARRYQKAIEVRAALETLQRGSGAASRAAPLSGVGAAVEGEAVDPTGIRSLAVLPLSNLSGDPEQEYFSDGMTDALITELAKIRALKVISRTSVMRFKDAREALPVIAAELGVDALVEGSVFRAGDSVRITAQLVHGSDTHLWAESYERELGDILSLQKEVARDIVERIEVALTPHEQEQLATPSAVDPEVYEAILKGRFHFFKFSLEGLEKAKFWLQRAIELDPDSAAAHAWLSNVYGAIGTWGDVRPMEVWPEAERLASRAIELDDTLADTHFVSGLVLAFIQRNWEAGERALRRGLELNPNSADGHYNYGLIRAGRGHLEEAVSLLDRAVELDPLSPGIVTDSALPLMYLERFEEAIERARSALEIAPDFWRANWILSAALAAAESFPEAVEAARRAVHQSGGSVRAEANLVAVLAMAGDEEEAREQLRTILDSADRRFLPPYAIASGYAAFGDLDDVFEWLEKGFEEHDLFMLFLAADILFRRTVGADPRYAELVQRLGLAPISSGG